MSEQKGGIYDPTDYLLIDTFTQGAAAIEGAAPTYSASSNVWDDSADGTGAQQYQTSATGSLKAQAGTPATAVCGIDVGQAYTNVRGRLILPTDTYISRLHIHASDDGTASNDGTFNSMQFTFFNNSSVLTTALAAVTAGSASAIDDDAGNGAVAHSTLNPATAFDFRIVIDGTTASLWIGGVQRTWTSALSFTSNTNICYGVVVGGTGNILYNLKVS